MARCLLTVESTAIVKGRGLLIFPGVRPLAQEKFHNGDNILIRKPDGSSSLEEIGALELPYPNPNLEVLILIKRHDKEAIPIGSEVWSVDN